MSLSIDSRSRKVLVKLDNLDKGLKKSLRNGLYTVGKLLRSTASRNILKRGRQGRVYKHKRRRHVSSVPGESWANKSGAARRAIKFKVRGSEELFFGTNHAYSGFLEFGTRRIKPRPAYLISLRENNKNIVVTLEKAIKDSLK